MSFTLASVALASGRPRESHRRLIECFTVAAEVGFVEVTGLRARARGGACARARRPRGRGDADGACLERFDQLGVTPHVREGDAAGEGRGVARASDSPRPRRADRARPGAPPRRGGRARAGARREGGLSVEFRLLGPAGGDGRRRRGGGAGRPRDRAPARRCCSAAERGVSVDRLIDAVWGETPPASARTRSRCTSTRCAARSAPTGS